MNSAIRILTGWLFVLFGIALILTAAFTLLWLLIYGIPMFIIGFFLLFNNGEEKIEARKDLNKS